MDMPLNILAPNPAMSEQSGPLMSFPRKSSFFDNKNAKKTKKKTNEYNDYMKKGWPTTRIMDKQDDKKTKLLKKYSKETLIQSVKQSKSKAKYLNTQNAPNYLNKVTQFFMIDVVWRQKGYFSSIQTINWNAN